MEEYIYIYIARCSLKVAKSGVKGHGKWYVRTVRSVGRRKGQVDKKIARRKEGGTRCTSEPIEFYEAR